jgi:hypothetical protein
METYLRLAQVADSSAVCDKAREFFRRVDACSFPLKAGASAKPYVCIELACLEERREYSREFSVKLSGCSMLTYSRVFNLVVKILGISSNLTIQYLCSLFGFDELVDKFTLIQRQFQAKSPQTGFDAGVVAAAVFISCCFVAKLQVDRKRVVYFTLGSLKQLEDLADEVLKAVGPEIQSEFLNIKESGGFSRKRTAPSTASEEGNVQQQKKKRHLYSMVFPWKGFQTSQSFVAFSNWKALLMSKK